MKCNEKAVRRFEHRPSAKLEEYLATRKVEEVPVNVQRLRNHTTVTKTLKNRCIRRAKDNGLMAVVQVLQRDNADLDETCALWQVYSKAYGFTGPWYKDQATVDKWKGNKMLSFKNYSGDIVNYIPKHDRMDMRPTVDSIISFLYLVIHQVEPDTPIITCPECGCEVPNTTACRYCGKELNEIQESIDEINSVYVRI